VFGKLLSKLGQEVKVAYNGLSAIEITRTYKPDVIFIDIAMPHMSGYELAEVLRKDPDLENTSLIALSGFGNEYSERSGKAGFNEHLIKPVSISDIQKVLSE